MNKWKEWDGVKWIHVPEFANDNEPDWSGIYKMFAHPGQVCEIGLPLPKETNDQL